MTLAYHNSLLFKNEEQKCRSTAGAITETGLGFETCRGGTFIARASHHIGPNPSLND